MPLKFCAFVLLLSLQNAFANYDISSSVITPNTWPDISKCPNVCRFNTLVRCNPYFIDEVGPVYGISDGICRVYNNVCMLQLDSCARENSCLCRIITTRREVCRQNCANCKNVCQTATPVCGYFAWQKNGNDTVAEFKKTFPNKCELDRYACLTGIAYVSADEGPCNECYYPDFYDE